MSGRAGRRGIDDRGIVILIVDEKMGPDVGKGLLKVSDAYRLNKSSHIMWEFDVVLFNFFKDFVHLFNAHYKNHVSSLGTE